MHLSLRGPGGGEDELGVAGEVDAHVAGCADQLGAAGDVDAHGAAGGVEAIVAGVEDELGAAGEAEARVAGGEDEQGATGDVDALGAAARRRRYKLLLSSCDRLAHLDCSVEVLHGRIEVFGQVRALGTWLDNLGRRVNHGRRNLRHPSGDEDSLLEVMNERGSDAPQVTAHRA